jgi:hypothetical protein
MQASPPVINKPRRVIWNVVRGAPKAMVFGWQSGGVFIPMDGFANLTCSVKLRNATTFNLTVGSGISFSTSAKFNNVANAKATIDLSLVQSNLIDAGDFTSFTITYLDSGKPRALILGRMVGI